jgi:hypothetical protein
MLAAAEDAVCFKDGLWVTRDCRDVTGVGRWTIKVFSSAGAVLALLVVFWLLP